jgi:hypothetical protein
VGYWTEPSMGAEINANRDTYSQEIRELDRSAIAARLWNAASETPAPPEERTSKDGRVVPHALGAWASIRSTPPRSKESESLGEGLLKSVLSALGPEWP